MTISSKFPFHNPQDYKNRILPDGINDLMRPNKPGIKNYGDILGPLLKLFGAAVVLKTPGKKWYVDANSLNEWKIRIKAEYKVPNSFNSIDEILNHINDLPKNTTPKATIREKSPVVVPKKVSHSPSKTSPVTEKLRISFSQEIDDKMVQFIKPNQKKVLMKLFDDAINTENPKDSFNTLVNESTFEQGGNDWGEEKAMHIKKHLLPLLSGSVNVNPTPSKTSPLRETFSPTIKAASTPSIPKILLDALKKTEEITHYNPQGKSIQERRPRLFAFLTDPTLKHTQQDYDFGLEDEFGVVWIDPTNPQDKDLILHFKKKYTSSLKLLTKFTAPTRPNPPLSMTDVTRFANNDTYAFLNEGLTNPITKDMIRDIMLWGATREVCRSKGIPFPHEEVIRSIFG